MLIARLTKFIFGTSFALGALGALGASGCLSRPIAEVHPETKNLYVDQVAQSAVDKIDLLFMVDNSASMADKQAILQEAVPVLVSRLTSPICVDSDSGAPTGESSKDGKCTNGEPEFNPVNDIHVGIVTSSLGAHGGFGNCTAKMPGTPNDRARLLGNIRPAGGSDPSKTFDVSRTWNGTGFLAWDALQKQTPPGTSQSLDFQAAFKDMIVAAGETGCGYEASLESWYRFLVDPEPPAQVTKVGNNSVRGSKLVVNADGSSECQGCDTDLLAQRKAFLRPDSLVAIVMLSDENDCSIRDDSQGWLVASSVTSDDPGALARRMPHATSVCDTNPNDRCCRSCASSDLDGCTPLAQDPSCKMGDLPAEDDQPNLRCWQQKRRFGVDLLYPAARYVSALKERTLTLQSDGVTQVPNPLFAVSGKGVSRDPSQVFLAGIVGVPWQDIADDASRSGTTRDLKYLTAEELVAKGRWPALIGDPEASPPSPPNDPFMIESPLQRSGTNPITGDAIVPATATSPTASPINGHEQNVPRSWDDLQYACTFPLKPSKTCTAANRSSCDCAPDGNGKTDAVTAANSPLCQPEAGGAATTEQRYAKAYPGTRELEVLKGLSGQGIVASICPKNPESNDPANDPSYGYNPAVAAIIERLKSQLTGKCLPRPAQIDPVTKQVQCKVVEAQVGNCDCTQPGRDQVPDALLASVRKQLEATGNCDVTGQPACSEYCGCQIVQEQGPDLEACRNNQPESSLGLPGYCYIDDPASPALKNCPANQKRLLRFVSGSGGQKIPAPGAYAFIACLGEAI